jgi:methionyl-tRNA formyltransferase
MKIILFTQEDPFYLVESTQDLITKIHAIGEHQIIQALITLPSIFGKKETFAEKALKTFKIFGFYFFTFYSFKFVIRKLILRKSVFKILTKNKIPVLNIETSINSKENLDLIKSLNADLILIIAGNQIIKKNVLKSTKYGVFNVHSSLLPNYKGLLPSFWVLKNKENKTGVTLYQLTEGIDDGPIISQKEIKIHPKTTQAKLIKELKIKANDLIIETLHLIKNKKNYKVVKGGSYFKFPDRNDVLEFKKNKKKFY